MKLIFKVLIIVIIFIVLGIVVFFNFSTEVVENEDNNVNEYKNKVIQDTINQTKIVLYFEDKESLELVKEEVNIDVKNLIDNPYMYIVNMLLSGPSNGNLQKCIPEGTKLNKAELKNNCVYVDFSKEFLNSSGVNSIYSVVNSLTELKEVNGVKFLIDGKEQENMKEIFVRK